MSERGHVVILRNFLRRLEDKRISCILDAGSGRTSLGILKECFPTAELDAVVYPGDQRKIDSICSLGLGEDACRILEKDICSESFRKEYDLVTAHLLLGEAARFGNTFEDLLRRLLEIRAKYLIIIDYLEDPRVDKALIDQFCEEGEITVIAEGCVKNEEPKVWHDFAGEHNFGYLLCRK